MSGQNNFDDTVLITRTEKRVKEPSLYKVLLLNDDFTPMEFVVDLLIKFFQKPFEEATQIMLNVHEQGIGVCGVYPREIAETKVMQVHHHARNHNHPLRCRMERN